MDILFSNVTCVTMDAEMHVYPNAFVGVTGGKISHVGKAAPEEKPQKIIDGTDKKVSVPNTCTAFTAP